MADVALPTVVIHGSKLLLPCDTILAACRSCEHHQGSPARTIPSSSTRLSQMVRAPLCDGRRAVHPVTRVATPNTRLHLRFCRPHPPNTRGRTMETEMVRVAGARMKYQTRHAWPSALGQCKLSVLCAGAHLGLRDNVWRWGTAYRLACIDGVMVRVIERHYCPLAPLTSDVAYRDPHARWHINSKLQTTHTRTHSHKYRTTTRSCESYKRQRRRNGCRELAVELSRSCKTIPGT